VLSLGFLECCFLKAHPQKKRYGHALQIRLEWELRRPTMAHRFTVIFEKEAEGGYHVFCPTLPGCHTQSETIDEGVVNIREAIELYVESHIEDGLPVPAEDIFIKPIEISA
jgi:predicted RNase H-like HicB family nuclease